MTDDPDDYRPLSRWRLLADPSNEASSVSDIAVIIEHMAPGDRVPLHLHEDVNECIVVVQGLNEVTIEDETFELADGDSAFIPRGTPHAQRNAGDVDVVIHAFFPSAVVDIKMLERNPAPGTEDRSPKHIVYDMRTGDFFERD
jgi:quercetin dioxygenase-like cupin family protein